jgi:uncharacterized protein
VSAEPHSLERIIVNLTSLQIRDIDEARRFYQEVLGCLEGTKGGGQWLEFNLYGQRIVCRLNPHLGKHGRVVSHYQFMDGKYVPIVHCGVALETTEWRSLRRRLKQHRVKFVVEPYRHITSAPGVQATLYLLDPSGNSLEVQSFCNSAEEFLRCERQRALARWMPWAMLAAFIVCCILLLPKSPRMRSPQEISPYLLRARASPACRSLSVV